MLNYSHIIWDFNGTVINDVDAGYTTINTMLKRRGLRTFADVDEYREVFGFPILDYYKKMGFDFKDESYSEVADEWAAEYKKDSAFCSVNEGVAEALEYFKSKGLTQIILSATEKSLLEKQLVPLGISGYFDELLALDNLLAFSKVDIARLWIADKKPRRALLIGDTLHDFETAKAIGADCALVACGHQSKARLQVCSTPIYDDIASLLAALTSD